MMINRNPSLVRCAGLGLLLAFSLLLWACSSAAPSEELPEPTAVPGPAGPQGAVGPQGPQGEPGLPGAAFFAPGPGLDANILGMEMVDGQPVVTVSLHDAAGIPLSPAHLEGWGFMIAQIALDEETGLSHYQNLILAEVQGQPYDLNGEVREPALPAANQPRADTNGIWETIDAATGSYTYTFGNELTLAFDPNLTTTIAAYLYRNGRADVANTALTFVPAGGEPALTREVVTISACNTCHNQLAFHGGTRQDTQLCVTCHTNQNIDPETGNLLDFRVMVHRIHRGEYLPSVESGEAYQIIGYRQSSHDYSDVAWPQDVRNCTTCHTGGADSANYKYQPQIAACTACHDNVNPVTSENHPGGARADGSCANCHVPDGNEFDASITGAHTIPTKSSQLLGFNIEILGVIAGAGQAPTVDFRITNNAGEVIDPLEADSLRITLAGPTSDYVTVTRETIYVSSSPDDVPVLEDLGDGVFRYQMTYTVPAGDSGTIAIGMEGYRNETIDGYDDPIRVASFNPVAYASLAGSEPTPRRQIVDVAKCNQCHNDLAIHGGSRKNPEYCVLCHNTTNSDIEVRPESEMPPTSIHFKVLIHSIHIGDQRSGESYLVYGFRGSLHDFTDLRFPGFANDCETCHLPGTYTLPLPAGVQPTNVFQDGTLVSSTPPATSACIACHDSIEAQGHVQLQTTADGIETCSVCHGIDREADVGVVHKP